MKAIVIAASLLVAGASSALAQFAPPPPPPPAPWSKGAFPYAERNHRVCMDKAWRLRSYERAAAADGRFSFRERRIMESLRRDLDRTCGRFRWRG